MDWEKGLVRVWWIKERSFVVVSLVLGFKVVAFLSKDFIFAVLSERAPREREMRERRASVVMIRNVLLSAAEKCFLFKLWFQWQPSA